MIYLVIIVLLCALLSSTVLQNAASCSTKHILTKHLLTIDKGELSKIFNPSIVKTDDGFLICARYSNITMVNIFHIILGQIKPTSRLCFIQLTKDWKIRSIIHDNVPKRQLEDPRIIKYRDMYLVSTSNVTKHSNLPVIRLYSKSLEFMKEYVYSGYDSDFKVQKNWCPFVFNGQLYVHTDSYPVWKVFKLTDEGVMTMHSSIQTKNLLRCRKFLRCSTSWIPFTESTMLCGLHTKVFHGVFPTIRTILVEIDNSTFLPVRRTSEFCISSMSNIRIQFLSGLERNGGNVILGFGIGNVCIELKRLSISRVQKMLITNLKQRF